MQNGPHIGLCVNGNRCVGDAAVVYWEANGSGGIRALTADLCQVRAPKVICGDAHNQDPDFGLVSALVVFQSSDLRE